MEPPVRARFMIAAEADADDKTTTHYVKQIQLDGQDEVYVFPIHLQKLTLHEKLLMSSTIKNARKSLTTRNTFRNPFVKMTPELCEEYLDADLNPCFRDEMLAEIAPSIKSYVESYS